MSILTLAFSFEKGIPHLEKEQFLRIVEKHGADKILFANRQSVV